MIKEAAKQAVIRLIQSHADDNFFSLEARAFFQEAADFLKSKQADAQPEQKADEREMFERDERASCLTRDEDEPDMYANPFVQSAWEGWQARAAIELHAMDKEQQSASDPVAWDEVSTLTVLNMTGDGPYGETDVQEAMDFLNAAESIRSNFYAAQQEPASPAQAQPNSDAQRVDFLSSGWAVDQRGSRHFRRYRMVKDGANWGQWHLTARDAIDAAMRGDAK